MRLQSRNALLAVLLVLSPVAADGHELQVGLLQRLEADSNVSAAERNPEADAIWVVRPYGVLRKRSGQLTYDFDYRPTIETYFTLDGIDGVNHRTRGEIGWEPTARHVFSADYAFSDSRSLRREDQDPTAATELEFSDRVRVRRFTAKGGYTYAIAPTWNASVEANIDQNDFSSSSLVNNEAYGGMVTLGHSLDPTFTLGAQVGARHRIFEQTATRPGSNSTTGNVGAFLRWVPDENWLFSAAGGPSLIETEIEEIGSRTRPRFYSFSQAGVEYALVELGCSNSPIPGFLARANCAIAPTAMTPLDSSLIDDRVTLGAAGSTGSQETDLTYFASVSLTRTFRRGEASAEYQRYESGAAGSATTAIADSVTLRGEWRIRADLVVGARAIWRREATVSDGRRTVELVNPAPGIQSAAGPRFIEFVGLASLPLRRRDEYQQFRLSANATYRFTENLRLHTGVSYLYGERVRANANVDFDVFRASIGIDYTFDAWTF